MAGEREVKVKVSMDTRQAERSVGRMRQSLGNMAQGVSDTLRTAFNIGGIGGAVAAVGAPIVGNMATGVRAVGGRAGRMAARASGLEALAGQIEGGLNAQQRTIQAFGIAGTGASEEQIRATFNAFKRIEDLRVSGRNRVREITDPLAVTEAQSVAVGAAFAGFITTLKAAEKGVAAFAAALKSGGKIPIG